MNMPHTFQGHCVDANKDVKHANCLYHFSTWRTPETQESHYLMLPPHARYKSPQTTPPFLIWPLTARLMSCLDLINATDDDTTPHTRASETVLGATLAVNGGIGCVLNAGVLAALWLMKSGGQPLCAMGVFIRSLTLSDTVYSLLGSLLQGIDATIGSWTMGPTLCRVHMFVGALAVNVSIGTMAAISIHR